MLPLFLTFLVVAGIHSQPLQENCTETERTFHDCLRKLHPKMIHSNDMDGFNSQKAAFLQCGAKHSDCYLQKTLMTMVNYLTENKEEELHWRCHECVQAGEGLQKCHHWPYNEHGFRVSLYEKHVDVYKCYKEVVQFYNCSAECIKDLTQWESMFLKQHYENRLSKFLLFVQINAALDENKPIELPEPLRQLKHCNRSEKIFQACMKNKTFDSYTAIREAYIQCGADKSKCYLQKHLMKMVNTDQVDAISELYELDYEELQKCEEKIVKMDTIGLECLRPGFDEHGFPKPDREFDYHEARCKADMALRTDVCDQNTVNYYKHNAIRNYKYALSEFSQYVNDAKRFE